MEKIDKIKCVLIDFENNSKTLNEAANEILSLFINVSQEQYFDTRNWLNDSLCYEIRCVECGEVFYGHPRRKICVSCANKHVTSDTKAV